MRSLKRTFIWTAVFILFVLYLFAGDSTTVCTIIKTCARKMGLLRNPIITTMEKPVAATTNDKRNDSSARCKKRIAIYMPGTGGFRSWREYEHLVERYTHATKRNERDPVSNLPMLRLQCPQQKCDIEVITTINTKWLNASDAIIVNLDKLNQAPKHQQPAIKALGDKTKWFMFAVESGDRYQYWNRDFKDIMFQFSITYHSESTITHPYGRYIPKEPTDFKLRNWATGKTGLAAWMASSCGSFSWPRFDWVKKLKTFIPVDMYGSCGNLKCDEKFDASKPASKNSQCMKTLQKYKFYLALENAECDEYLTEKFWGNALLAGAVPIVYGGRKDAYLRVAPPHSFIHISDFDSVDKLADYVKYLDTNDDKYNEYFAWRYKGRVEQVYPPLNISEFMCKMVPVLAQDGPSVPFKTVQETDLYRGCSHTPFEGSVLPIPKWKPR